MQNYALQWIDIQRNDFKRLGVLGDWDHPYVTLVPDYEAVQIHVFGEMAKKAISIKARNPFTGARTAKPLWQKLKSNTVKKSRRRSS